MILYDGYQPNTHYCATSMSDCDSFPPFCTRLQIKGSDAGWTLGYMLNLTNMIPAEAPDTPPLPHAGYVSIVTVMAVLLFVLLVVSVLLYRPRCSKPAQII